MPLAFVDIVRKYRDEGVVFQSARARKPAYYAITLISDTSFTVDRLTANEPDPSCSFSKLDAKLRRVEEHGGHCPLATFDEAVTQQMAYAQSAELAVSLDRSAIVDIRDRVVAIKHFRQALEGLNVNRSSGKPVLYKPVSLWCVLDAVGNGELQQNRIPFEWLLPRFIAKAGELGIARTPLVAAEAFFHLTNDLIWMLAYHNPHRFFQDTPTVTMVREQVRHAILKEPLWSLVQDPAIRADLMTAIESKWFPGQSIPNGLPRPEQIMGTGTSKLNGETADLNVILYGPPGTGKTYHTFSHAVGICDGELPNSREAIVQRFKALREEGRIEVVTFHQSYAYEDFVEGIRPVLESNGDGESAGGGQDIRYECRDGVFKRICDVAGTKRVKQSSGGDFGDSDVWKMSLGDTQDPEQATIYDECIEKNYLLLGYGGANDFTGCDNWDAIRKMLQAAKPSITEHDFSIQAVDAFKNGMSVGDLVVISDGNRHFRAIARITGDYRFLADRPSYRQMRPVEWLAVFKNSLSRETIYEKGFSQMTIYRLKKSALKIDALRDLLGGGSDETKNYVLIIDEINRGNIAKILGELITLLEPDKRIGAQNELQVVLPNSGKAFGVPSNLYILGTMNTADRSIAFLDTALRRRFTFSEMMPDYDVVREEIGDEGMIGGVDVPHLLASMNRRIEVLSDRDHQLGHAYLVHVRSLADLRRVFMTKIIPLLQEYFYGDWSRICAVLGCPIDSESGQQIGSNTRPLIRAALLAAENLGADGEFSNRIRCDVNTEFTRATESDLAGFFTGVCDPLSEP